MFERRLSGREESEEWVHRVTGKGLARRDRASSAGFTGAGSALLTSDGGALSRRSPRTPGGQPPAVLRLAWRPRRPAARLSGLLASDGGSPAPRRPAARLSGLLASDGGSPAPRRPAARLSGLLASDGGSPAPRRPAA